MPSQRFVLQFLSCAKPPLWYIHGSSTSSANTKRRLAAASGGMAWATMRPAGQEAPHRMTMPSMRAWGPKLESRSIGGAL